MCGDFGGMLALGMGVCKRQAFARACGDCARMRDDDAGMFSMYFARMAALYSF